MNWPSTFKRNAIYEKVFISIQFTEYFHKVDHGLVVLAGDLVLVPHVVPHQLDPDAAPHKVLPTDLTLQIPPLVLLVTVLEMITQNFLVKKFSSALLT